MDEYETKFCHLLCFAAVMMINLFPAVMTINLFPTVMTINLFAAVMMINLFPAVIAINLFPAVITINLFLTLCLSSFQHIYWNAVWYGEPPLRRPKGRDSGDLHCRCRYIHCRIWCLKSTNRSSSLQGHCNESFEQSLDSQIFHRIGNLRL